MPTREEMEELIKNLSKEHKTSEALRAALNPLIEASGKYYLDHNNLTNLNGVISNAQFRLQLMLEEESRSLSNLIKKALVTETLKFMVPFILGLAVAYFGLTHYQVQQSAVSPQQQQQSKP